ncbi:ankyrin-1 isoform X1 [Ixodes scapularis]|uniref:ankyrin-1 isoform X1 n=1 Tax=Ixodes scapularis TaxID=6945 RepID=UPI001AD6C4D0|nr:ankyrin-1 isoform X1 [Ixodes scapularis]
MSSELGDFMYEAVTRSDVENVKALLREGIRVNTLVQSGYTLLGQAVQIGNLEVLKVLLHAEDFFPADDSEYSAGPEDPYSLDDTLDAFLRPNDAAWNRSNDEDVSPRKTGLQEDPLPCIYLPRDASSHHRDNPHQRGLGLFQSLWRLAPLRRKTDVNLPDFYDRMPIHYAAQQGRPEVLDLLIKAGCRINVSDSDNVTPLQLAVTGGHEEVTHMLLKAGSRVNSKNSDRSSTLHIAASQGHASIVERLLQYGAAVDTLDSLGRTPLLIAVIGGHHDVAKVLINYQANVNMEGLYGDAVSVLKPLQPAGSRREVVPEDEPQVARFVGRSPLWVAVAKVDVVMAQLLLDAGAKVLQGKRFLHDAVSSAVPELLQLLLRRGVSVNTRDVHGNSPLHLAIRKKSPSMLRELVQFGGDVNITNSLTGLSLLHEAVTDLDESNFDIFRSILDILLSAGCRMNAESGTTGDTPLFRSIIANKLLFAEELIREGCDVNCGNVYTCAIDNLWLAKRLRELRLVKMIVYAGYDLNRFAVPDAEVNQNVLGAQETAIRHWLRTVKTNPLRLSELCRITIRRRLGQSLVSKVSRLVLPASMKDFLLLDDVRCELAEASVRFVFW